MLLAERLRKAMSCALFHGLQEHVNMLWKKINDREEGFSRAGASPCNRFALWL